MDEKELTQVDLFTDGGADPNPGKGAWAIILQAKGKCKEFSQAYTRTTNNRMELLAVISGLEKLKEKCAVTVYSDSQYVVNGIEKGWAKSWRAKNWFRKSEPVPNADLWVRLLDLVDQHQVSFLWVKGHNGHPENERCDQLASQTILENNCIEDVGYLTEKPVKMVSINPVVPHHSAKAKVLKEGDFCTNCQTPVIKRVPTNRKFHANQSYYFEFVLVCPSCKTVFNTEEAKREIVKEKGLFG